MSEVGVGLARSDEDQSQLGFQLKIAVPLDDRRGEGLVFGESGQVLGNKVTYGA